MKHLSTGEGSERHIEIYKKSHVSETSSSSPDVVERRVAEQKQSSTDCKPNNSRMMSATKVTTVGDVSPGAVACLETADVVRPTSAAGSSNDNSTEACHVKRCDVCNKDVPVSNWQLHVVRCAKDRSRVVSSQVSVGASFTPCSILIHDKFKRIIHIENWRKESTVHIFALQSDSEFHSLHFYRLNKS